MPRHYERPIEVYLESKQEWTPESEVTIENIEEDATGRDLLTFVCPECKKTHRSLRVAR